MLLRHGLVEGPRVGVKGCHHGAGLHEARVEVGVPVGDVLSGNSRQPDDLLKAQEGLEFRLGGLFRDAWVAVGVQNAALRNDGRSIPVDLDPTTLQDERRCEKLDASKIGDLLRKLVIQRMPLLLAPAVEVELHGPEYPGFADSEDGTRVTDPEVVRFCLKHLRASQGFTTFRAWDLLGLRGLGV